jgi:hypothetical protein
MRNFQPALTKLLMLGMHLTQVAPTGCYRVGSNFGGPGDVGIGCWTGVHSLLHKTVEELSPTLGFSPVKAKRKLVEVVRQMLV